MKKMMLPLFAIILLTACKDTGNGHGDHGKGGAPQTAADSLEQAVDKGHHEGMGKIGRLHKTRDRLQALVDSIASLPAKAQEQTAPYVSKLKETIGEMNAASEFMDNWMFAYGIDSLKDQVQARIKYLAEEKLKLEKLNKAINNGIAKADSLLQAKF